MFELHPSKVATVKNDVLSGFTVALALFFGSVTSFLERLDPGQDKDDILGLDLLFGNLSRIARANSVAY